MSGILQTVFQNQRSFRSPADFIATLVSNSYEARGGGTAVDSLGNIYVAYQDTTNSKSCLAAYTESGALIFNKKYEITAVTFSGFPLVVVDSSDTIYLVTGDSTDVYVIRLNTSGAVSAAYNIAAVGPLNAVAISGTSLVIGTHAVAIGANFMQFSTTGGTIDWAKNFQNSSNYAYVTGIAFSPSYTYLTGGIGPYVWFARMSGGSVSWLRGFGSNGSPGGIYADADSNVYFGVRSASGYSIVAKHDSSFAGVSSIWTNSAVGYLLKGFSADSSGYLYASGDTQTKGYVMKLDSALNISYQRTMTPSVGYVYYNNNAVSGDKLISVGYAQDYSLGYPSYVSTLCAPTDGSKTGNYAVGGYTYTYASVATSWTNNGAQSTFSIGSIIDISPVVTSVSATGTTVSPTSNITIM